MRGIRGAQGETGRDINASALFFSAFEGRRPMPLGESGVQRRSVRSQGFRRFGLAGGQSQSHDSVPRAESSETADNASRVQAKQVREPSASCRFSLSARSVQRISAMVVEPHGFSARGSQHEDAGQSSGVVPGRAERPAGICLLGTGGKVPIFYFFRSRGFCQGLFDSISSQTFVPPSKNDCVGIFSREACCVDQVSFPVG